MRQNGQVCIQRPLRSFSAAETCEAVKPSLRRQRCFSGTSTPLPPFLRAYSDCDGYDGRQGVILSTSSEVMSEQVQLILLNFGILSRRRPQQDGCWHVVVVGASAERFLNEIGFGLSRKQQALTDYVHQRKWFKEEKWEDEIG